MSDLLEKIRDNPHHLGQLMGYDKLTGIHSEWIKHIWTNPADSALQAHRNSYKTTAVLVVGAIWWLLFNPEGRVLIVRKAHEDASAILGEIIQHLESAMVKAVFSMVYGKTYTDLIKTSKKSYLSLIMKTKPSKEGNIETIGIGGSITGRHYDRVIGDDIVTIKDRISRAEREYTKTFVRELKNIPVLDGGKIGYTGTPWHGDDAWSILPEAKKYPLGSIKIPELTSDKIADLRASMTASLFSANYELRHISDIDRIFDDPVYGKWPEPDLATAWAPRAWLDPSYSGKNTTSLTILVEHKGQWHGKGYVWPDSVVDCYDRVVNILNQHKAGTLYVETNADHEMSVRDLRQMYPSVVGVRESENKHNKIVSYGRQHFNKIIWDENCQPEYMSQVLDYQEGQEPDDAPDGLSSLMRQLGFDGGGFKLKTIGPDGIKTQSMQGIHAAVDPAILESGLMSEWGLFK